MRLECNDPEALKPLRLTPDALEAKIESLRITFTQWPTEMEPERQDAIREEAFGAEVRGAEDGLTHARPANS